MGKTREVERKRGGKEKKERKKDKKNVSFM